MMADFDFSLEAGMMQRVDQILAALDELAVNDQHNFERRLQLLNILYNELYSRIENVEDRKKAEDVLLRMSEEVQKKRQGIPRTYFLSYANVFERELRDFIQKNINRPKPKVSAGVFYG